MSVAIAAALSAVRRNLPMFACNSPSNAATIALGSSEGS